jgi:predicted dehydrogenase
VIADPKINTVVIVTRHHLHAKQALAALRTGKNVFCEKPLCLTEEDLQSIIRAYVRSTERTVLLVGFNRRFAPMTKKLRAFLAEISEPLALHYRINAGFLPPDHWVNDRQQGGGRILGEVCHFIDLLMFLAASPIAEVETRALGTSSRYSGDNVLISLKFQSGSEATISYLANGDRSFSKERIEVFGGGRTAVLDDFRRLDLIRNGSKLTTHSRWKQDKGHRAEWSAFVQAVEQAGQTPIPFEEIVCSMLATLKADQSCAFGRRLAVDTSTFIDTALENPSRAPDE